VWLRPRPQRRALVLYCATLPFALVDTLGWVAVVATFLVAYVFFGIEEIGVEIEDPFGLDDNDLPLERICGNIQWPGCRSGTQWRPGPR
jgi:putative membrane protein